MYHPQLLRGLVVMNAPHPAVFFRELDFAQALRMLYVGLAQIPIVPEATLKASGGMPLVWAMRYLSGATNPFSEDIVRIYRKMWSKPKVLTSMLAYYRAALFGNSPLWEGNRAVRVPTLMIWGMRDLVLGGDRFIENLAPWVEEAKIQRIEEAGHWVQQERPKQVNIYIERFLAGES